MKNLEEKLEQHKSVKMRLVVTSDNNLLKSELDSESKYAGQQGISSQGVNRAVYRYLEHYINEGFAQMYQEIIKQLKEHDENISDEELTYQANRLLIDENHTFKASNFSIPKASFTVQVVGEEDSNVFYTQEVAISDETIKQWSLYNSNDNVGGIGASFYLDGFNELNQINSMLYRHNESIELLRQCDPNDPREKQLVVEFCEGRPSDGIPEGAVFNRRLLQNIEALHERELASQGYSKLYIGIRYVDSDDILQLARVDLGSNGALDDLYDALRHFQSKYMNTLPFDN